MCCIVITVYYISKNNDIMYRYKDIDIVPKSAYYVMRTRVLTVLVRLIQLEKIHSTIVE